VTGLGVCLNTASDLVEGKALLLQTIHPLPSRIVAGTSGALSTDYELLWFGAPFSLDPLKFRPRYQHAIESAPLRPAVADRLQAT